MCVRLVYHQLYLYLYLYLYLSHRGERVGR